MIKISSRAPRAVPGRNMTSKSETNNPISLRVLVCFAYVQLWTCKKSQCLLSNQEFSHIKIIKGCADSSLR